MQEIDLNHKTILITGAAGFIGANLILRLLSDIEDSTLIGIDNFNDYYDPALKQYRLEKIYSAQASSASNKFRFIEGDIGDSSTV